MKKVVVRLLATDAFSIDELKKIVFPKTVVEIEGCEERKLKTKDENVLTENSFDSLMEGLFEFAQGLWLAIKGFAKMARFAIVTIVEGVRWMWKKGVGKEKKTKGGKT